MAKMKASQNKAQSGQGLKKTIERGEVCQASVLGKRAAPAAFEMGNEQGAKNTFKRSASDQLFGQQCNMGLQKFPGILSLSSKMPSA